MGNIKINGVDYSGGGASTWDELTEKPFENIGNGLSVDEDGNLNAEGEAIPDNVAYLGGEATPSVPTPRDADTLEGHPSSYFAKASDVSSTEWKYHGDKVGAGNMQLPTNYNEILIVIKDVWHFSIPIPKAFLTEQTKSFTSGCYFDGNNHPFILFDVSLSTVTLTTNTTNYASAEWTVYYR